MSELGDVISSSFARAPWGWYCAAVITLALIKAWPSLAKTAIEDRASIRREKAAEAAEERAEKRKDLTACEAELKAMGDRVDAIEAKANQLDRRLFGTLTAYRILELEVVTHVPGSPALDQARAVLRECYRPSFSVNIELEELGASIANIG